MASTLRDNVNSQYVEAANALRGKRARRRIVAYVESYDDVYFWRTVFNRFENDKRFFEVMLPSRKNLSRGKKSVLMNFIGDHVGKDMIACVDADYDYLLQGATDQSHKVLDNDYVIHTYAYAIENLQCYVPSLHEVCVGVTLNDHRIFDFTSYFKQYSEICFPALVWSVWSYRTGNHSIFSLSDLNRLTDPGGFTLNDPQKSLDNLRHKVNNKIRELQRKFPDNKEAYLKLKDELRALGVQPSETYLYMQGHHLFDAVVAPILTKVCETLQQEREREISSSAAHDTQRRNELSCYENSTQDVKVMLKKNLGYMQSRQFALIQRDVRRFLSDAPRSAFP